jgi:hypothetical protein
MRITPAESVNCSSSSNIYGIDSHTITLEMVAVVVAVTMALLPRTTTIIIDPVL